MSLTVLVFAGARDAIGRETVEVAIDGPLTARALLERLVAMHPALAPWSGALRVAVNGAYAGWDDLVHEGDEVAIIPPVAGG
ncbi:MAG: MoaD/ThiS family protein [Polyangiales bacterium]